MLGDIAILTGGQVISEEVGPSSRHAEPDLLGHASQGRRHQGRDDHRRGCWRPGPDHGPGQPDPRRDREYRQRLRPREAAGAPGQPAGGVAVIKAGAATEVETKERAPHRGRRAQRQGCRRGGHRRRWRGPAAGHQGAFEKLELEGDEATGANIVRVASSAPLKQIAINAGPRAASWREVGDGCRRRSPNAATGEYVDLIAAGIIDLGEGHPLALQNAASIAALFLTTEAVIADKPEKAASMAPGGDEMGGKGLTKHRDGAVRGLTQPHGNTSQQEGGLPTGSRPSALLHRGTGMPCRTVGCRRLRTPRAGPPLQVFRSDQCDGVGPGPRPLGGEGEGVRP